MTNTNIKVVNTHNLKRLIQTAEVLGLNQYPDIKKLNLEIGGFHVLELMLFDHQGHTNRDITHHRVRVMAHVWQPHNEKLTPAVFLLDVRAEDWDLMIDVESFSRSLNEINNFKGRHPLRVSS